MTGPGKDSGVGKGRPPREHQFAKGVSGNPKGRPKKLRPGEIPAAHVPFTSQTILKVAFLPVRVKMPDGGIREVPSYEAVLYAMRASALKGNVHAQKSYLDFLRKTEQERLTIHAMLLASQLTLKVEQEIKLRKWKESDKAEKNFFVHPDDIEIDPKLGNVAFTAPILAAEKEAREKLIEYRDCLGAFLDPSSSILRVMKLDGNYEKKIADLIQSYDEANALLPLGLRKERSK